MDLQNRKKALLEIIRQGLHLGSQLQTSKQLGNRLKYIGLSDVAKYSECPRAAIASKIFPSDDSLGQLLTFQRGHWFERGLGEVFSNLDLKYMHQLEIAMPHKSIPLRSHLDFTLIWDKPEPAIRIVEVKSVSKLPDRPYDSHIFQAQGQVDLLCHLWQQKVFALRDDAGNILYENASFPELCKMMHGKSMPSSPTSLTVESWIIYLSMQDATCFGPYQFQQESLDCLLELAGRMWQEFAVVAENIGQLQQIPYARGYYPLCGFCQVSADCPKFAASDAPGQWDAALEKLADLKAQKAAVEDEIKDIESGLKQAAQTVPGNNWLSTDKYRFRLNQVTGRRTLDRDLLLSELAGIFANAGIQGITPESVLSVCEKQGAPSARLQIVPVR